MGEGKKQTTLLLFLCDLRFGSESCAKGAVWPESLRQDCEAAKFVYKGSASGAFRTGIAETCGPLQLDSNPDFSDRQTPVLATTNEMKECSAGVQPPGNPVCICICSIPGYPGCGTTPVHGQAIVPMSGYGT